MANGRLLCHKVISLLNLKNFEFVNVKIYSLTYFEFVNVY